MALAAASPQTLGFAVLAIAYFLLRYLSRTDVPKIKGLPEIPGWPIFGSLYELGEYHARVAGKWAKKYGPVFQARLGNKVSLPRLATSILRQTCVPNVSIG